jgi:CheY-like chemotaxis protein
LALRLLEKAGHRVTAAPDGQAAFDAWANADERDPFDFILMDVQTPKPDGLVVTAMIRKAELESGEHMHIVAMTAHAMSGDREKCIAAGMDDYFGKPIDKQELLEVLGKSFPVSVRIRLAAASSAGQHRSPFDPTFGRNHAPASSRRRLSRVVSRHRSCTRAGTNGERAVAKPASGLQRRCRSHAC